MKNFFKRLSVIIIPFIFSWIISFLGLRYFPLPESFEKADLAQTPTVEYCDLKNDPHNFDGKIVRLKTQLNWFDHGYFLDDEKCLGKGDEARAAVIFYKGNREENDKTLENAKEIGKFNQSFKITVVGRFTYPKTLGMSDSIQDRTHLHFEIFKIESAKVD